MLWSRFFIPTSKDTPTDAVAAAHRLAIRAGLIRQVTAGAYAYLPLGLRVLRKIERIIREEMDAVGALEMQMPSLQPLAWWQLTGRDAACGKTLLSLAGEGWQRSTVLGPTREEAFTDLARAHINSYRQLPLVLYQIQPAFRGEEHPGGGLLRLREFLMMDAYSFGIDQTQLDTFYGRIYSAYGRIFTRCGLPFVVAEAESGAMGGDVSHEFMVLSAAGEDVVARSEDGAYTANVQRAVRQTPAIPADAPVGEMLPLTAVHTPGCAAIEDVCRFMDVPAARMIKTLVYELPTPPQPPLAKGGREGDGADAPEGGRCVPEGGRDARPPEKSRLAFVVVCVRGDHEVNEFKLRRLLRERGVEGEPVLCALETATAAGFVIGYVGPHIVNTIDGLLLIDADVRAVHNGVSGANRREYHVSGFNWSRELKPERLAAAVVADLRMVREGDPAMSPPALPGSRLRLAQGIEIGHVFKLGTRYSAPFGATFLDATGRPRELVMGSYGIGLDRILAATIEAHHDDDGIRFPMSIAPFEVLVVVIDVKDEEVLSAAKELHDQLADRGMEVLLDNRDERAGFKFKDADLIGVPLRITVSRKILAEGIVELKSRTASNVERLAPEAAVEEVIRRVEAARSAVQEV